MSTTHDTNEPERGGDDMLAAEYVLGVLSAAERQAASRRVDADAAFAGLVDAWEVRLSGLADAYEAVEAPASIKPAIDRRLFSSTAARPARPGLLASLALWRGLAAAAVAGLLLVLAVPSFTPPAPEPTVERLAASLADDATGVRYLAVYDPARGDIGLSRLGDERPAGQDFELWVIAGSDAPVSLGVVPTGESTRLTVSDEVRTLIASGALFAISQEPQGGSPTGQPTGPVVAAGDLRTI